MRKRLMILFFTVLFFFAALSGRLGYLSLSDAVSTADTFHSYSLVIDRTEPNIYTADGRLLTNNQSNYVVVLPPNEAAFSELYKVFEGDELTAVAQELAQGYPLVRPVDYFDGTTYLHPVAVNVSNSTCRQLLNRSSSGLLTYLPESIGTMKISFPVDALGRVLNGAEGTIQDKDYTSKQGLKTTLHSQIQQITYEAMCDVTSGCAVVMAVDSGDILACVTKPDDCYLNKPLQQYAVGSVFKIVVAACAIENNMDIEYTCLSNITVGDTEYSCYDNHAHGMQHLKEALGNSCNCYFVNLGLHLGAERLLATAEKLGFTAQTNLFADWFTDNARLPSEEELRSNGELSLMSFGQGKLTATPIQFATLMATVANHGIRQAPRLVTAEVDAAGRETFLTDENGEQVMKEDNAEELLDDLRYVVSDGNAKSADYHSQSAGKTATAQTGQYKGERELLNCWFAGIFPYESPRYAVVIMVEDGEGGAKECCPIFRTIVENLDNM